MPRHARLLSESGYAHLIVPGIGRQAIFEEREDYEYYLSILRRFSRETGVSICAYCLMENHVHLLTHDGNNQVPLLMKKMGVSYSYYFNRKYERTGHLFQDRYLSEPIEDETYLLAVFRYILNNPVKAGLCEAAKYEWSSYALYASPSTFVDTRLLQELIGDGPHYIAFIAMPNEDRCLDCDVKPRVGDARAKEIVSECIGTTNAMALQNMDRASRDAALSKLKERGLTIRQIERMTGINRNIVQRAR